MGATFFFGIIHTGCFVLLSNSEPTGQDSVIFIRNQFVYIDSLIIKNCRLTKDSLFRETSTRNYCDIIVYKYFSEVSHKRNPDDMAPIFFTFKTRFGKVIEEGYLMCMGCERSFFFGEYRAYHRNGQLYVSGQYDLAGDKTGEWVLYDRKGRLFQKGTYLNGRKIGEWYEYDKEVNIITILGYQVL